MSDWNKRNARALLKEFQAHGLAQNLRITSYAGEDLRGQVFGPDEDLSHVDFQNADLSDARLTGVNLSGANLTDANLTGARLDDASLRGADLTGARFDRASLMGADLTGARLNNTTWNRTRLAAAVFSSDAAVSGWGAALPGQIPRLQFGPPSPNENAVAWHPSGELLAVASGALVALWDLTVGVPITLLHGHQTYVRSLAFSSDGTFLATTSADKTVRIWDTSTGATVESLPGQNDTTQALAFGPDGILLATGNGDIRLRNLTTGTVTDFKGIGKRYNTLTLSSKGARLAVSNGYTTRIWDTATRTASTIENRHGHSWSMAFSGDGARLATVGVGDPIRVWDIASGIQTATLPSHSRMAQSIAWSPDSTRLASVGSTNESIQIQEATTGTIAATVENKYRGVRSITFSSDSKCITISEIDPAARVWTIDSASASAFAIEELSGLGYQTAFSPDGAHMATLSGGETIRIWNTTTLAATAEVPLTKRAHYPHTIALNSGGTRIVSADINGGIRSWNTISGVEIAEYDRPGNGSIHSMAFSPDGAHIATAHIDGTIQIRDTTTLDSAISLDAHRGAVRAVAFSHDGTHIASSGVDGTVRITDLTGKREPIVSLDPDVSCLTFSTRSTELAIGHDAGHVTIRPIHPDSTQKPITFIGLRDGGWAVFHSEHEYELYGEPDGSFWWSAGLCRFEPGELDRHGIVKRLNP